MTLNYNGSASVKERSMRFCFLLCQSYVHYLKSLIFRINCLPYQTINIDFALRYTFVLVFWALLILSSCTGQQLCGGKHLACWATLHQQVMRRIRLKHQLCRLSYGFDYWAAWWIFKFRGRATVRQTAVEELVFAYYFFLIMQTMLICRYEVYVSAHSQ